MEKSQVKVSFPLWSDYFPFFPSKWAFNGVTEKKTRQNYFTNKTLSWLGNFTQTMDGFIEQNWFIWWTIAVDWSHYTRPSTVNGRDEDFFFVIDKNDLWMSQQKSPKPSRELNRKSFVITTNRWKILIFPREFFAFGVDEGWCCFTSVSGECKHERDAVR